MQMCHVLVSSRALKAKQVMSVADLYICSIVNMVTGQFPCSYCWVLFWFNLYSTRTSQTQSNVHAYLTAYCIR